MISIIKKEIKINDELKSKILWACKFSKKSFEITNGNLHIVEHSNLGYVEPHKLIVKDKLYLFFNEHEYFYIGNLNEKIPISKLQEYISRH